MVEFGIKTQVRCVCHELVNVELL